MSPVHVLQVQDLANNKYDTPVQPVIDFPRRRYGSSSRCFQVSWYTLFPWIEYSIERDAAYCFACRFFGVSPDVVFTHSGFHDWKHARGKDGVLTYHNTKCTKHKNAMLSWQQYKSTVANSTSVSVQLDRQRLKSIQGCTLKAYLSVYCTVLNKA